MNPVFPHVRIGQPIRHQSLTVFPLFTDCVSDLQYQLANIAISKGTVVVQEVNHGGSVPELLVNNKGRQQVLFIEGEELLGAKQNRVINTSVLVDAKSKIKIPVSCVEQGRWSYESKKFQPSGGHSPSKMRHLLKRSVTRSSKTDGLHRSDQAGIWDEVERCMAAHRAQSPTRAMKDTFDAVESQAADFRERLRYVDGATGMAVAVGREVVAIDVFDKPDTCQRVWNRLLSGVILDAIASAKVAQTAEAEDVQSLLLAAADANWVAVNPVGQGQEYRAEFQEDQGSVLAYQTTVVHGSVVSQS